MIMAQPWPLNWTSCRFTSITIPAYTFLKTAEISPACLKQFSLNHPTRRSFSSSATAWVDWLPGAPVITENYPAIPGLIISKSSYFSARHITGRHWRKAETGLIFCWIQTRTVPLLRAWEKPVAVELLICATATCWTMIGSVAADSNLQGISARPHHYRMACSVIQ